MQLRLAARSLVRSPTGDSLDIGDIFPSAADEAPCRSPSPLTVARRTANGPF